MDIHFVSVGCGNMTLLLFPDGRTYIYDCNVTNDNEDSVLRYLSKAMGMRTAIDVFVCSHRDADHMRGIEKINKKFPIQLIRDAGVEGTTTDSSEYRTYMAMRRSIGSSDIQPKTYQELGAVMVRWMNAKNDQFTDANDQSIVMKIEYGRSSVMLTGDTSFRPWKEVILPFYDANRLSTSILLGSHHGSLSFFDDPSDERSYYTAHMEMLSPAMTIISVGPNVHDLPDKKALGLYERHSSGSSQGNKVFTTDDKGNMRLTLKNDGGWSLATNQ